MECMMNTGNSSDGSYGSSISVKAAKAVMGKKPLATLLMALLAGSAAVPVTADDAPPSVIHGFGSLQLSNDYITPRGLLVTNEGVTAQALVGLVMLLPDDFSLVAGAWNDVDGAHEHNSGTGAWVEEDFFAGVGYSPTKQIKLSASYDSWNFPGGPAAGSPSNEQNIELVAKFDDSAPGRAWSLQPHAEVFVAIASPSSTVVLGRPANQGATAYLELGVTPTYEITSFPVTLTLPTWISAGPADFWCDQDSGSLDQTVVVPVKGRSCGNNHFGVFSTGLTAKTPASFIPPQYGHWYFYAGAQYFNLLNRALVDAQLLTVGSANGHRDVVNGFAGIGFGF
jgi:hypothetical protein